MLEKLSLIVLFGAVIAVIWFISTLSVPRKGYTKLLERAAFGAVLSLLCYLLLTPFGISIPQNPLSALLAGYLGFPGVAFAAFISRFQ